MVTKVRAQFGEFEGTAPLDAHNHAASSIGVTIQSASLSTGSDQRDAHLRSADFFVVDRHPAVTFVSTTVERDGTDWSVTGELTIGEVTKPVTVVLEETAAATDPFGHERVGFEGMPRSTAPTGA